MVSSSWPRCNGPNPSPRSRDRGQHELDEETRRRVLALGARALLAKPVDPTALAHAVGPLLAPAGG